MLRRRFASSAAPSNWRRTTARPRLDRSFCLLLAGDFAQGFRDYEWRWRTAKPGKTPRVYDAPLWLSQEPVAGKTVLLHAEQGLGDTLQFCRYVPLVAALGARVILAAPSPTHGLLTSLPGVALLITQSREPPLFDLQCPLMSLPLALGTTLATIPAATPYLTPPDAHRRKWQARLGPRRALRVGFAWSGNPQHSRDADRSMPLDLAATALADGVEVHCLQRELRAADVFPLAMRPGIAFYGDALAEVADTAALTAEMDLVVSVDTAILHLAGSLGRPAWAMLPAIPDWRWMQGRTDTPWYPTMRLFRQAEQGDWTPVLAQHPHRNDRSRPTPSLRAQRSKPEPHAASSPIAANQTTTAYNRRATPAT